MKPAHADAFATHHAVQFLGVQRQHRVDGLAVLGRRHRSGHVVAHVCAGREDGAPPRCADRRRDRQAHIPAHGVVVRKEGDGDKGARVRSALQKGELDFDGMFPRVREVILNLLSNAGRFTNVRIHHNMLYNNASIGDALFSGTPAGAGAITVSPGADGYQIDHNWIAGNLSTGDGGGLQHLGMSFKGKINNNYVLFNQSTNPTLPTSGGGIIIEGANLDRQLNGNECGSTNDQDCPPGLGEGTGFGMVIDGNLIVGNSAESGSGGGLRLRPVNRVLFSGRAVLAPKKNSSINCATSSGSSICTKCRAPGNRNKSEVGKNS